MYSLPSVLCITVYSILFLQILTFTRQFFVLLGMGDGGDGVGGDVCQLPAGESGSPPPPPTIPHHNHYSPPPVFLPPPHQYTL